MLEPTAASQPGTRRSVTVRVEEALWRWTRIAAINQNTTCSTVVELALERLRATEEEAAHGRDREGQGRARPSGAAAR